MLVVSHVMQWTNLKAMQNQMMAMKSVANLSSADRRDATFFITCEKQEPSFFTYKAQSSHYEYLKKEYVKH